MIDVTQQPLAERRALAFHMQPRVGSALFDLATSVTAYLALVTVMFLATGHPCYGPRARGSHRWTLLACRLEGCPDRSRPAASPHGRGRDLALLCPAPVRGRLLAAARRLELRRGGTSGQLVSSASADPPVLHREHRAPSHPPPERAHPELQPPGSP